MVFLVPYMRNADISTVAEKIKTRFCKNKQQKLANLVESKMRVVISNTISLF